MEKRIFIVGGNGFARDCYWTLRQVMNEDPEISFGGFLGHGGFGHTVDYCEFQKFYCGEQTEHLFGEHDFIVIGAGYPQLRKKIYDDLKKRGCRFFNLIDPAVRLNPSVKMGEANVIAPPCFPSLNITIGTGNVFVADPGIGHDVVVGDFNFFGPKSQLLGNVRVGDMNTIGAGAVLLPHAKIGSRNKIAPLSAVYRGCGDDCCLLGNPALKIN